MARPDKRGQHAIQVRRSRVSQLYLRRFSQWDIAQKCGVDRSVISKDLKAIHQEWEENRAGERSRWIGRELAAIDRLERTCWRAWDRSRKDAETRTAKTVRTAGGERTEASKREEGQTGDPRFLAGIERCIELRCKILGIITSKHEHSGPDGGAIPVEVREIVVRNRSEASAVLSALAGPAGVPGRN